MYVGVMFYCNYFFNYLGLCFLCNLSTPSLSPNIYHSFNPLSLLLYLENSDARVNTIAVQFDADI